jgi:hypothetical protein
MRLVGGIYDRWMEGQASELRDMDDALSHSYAYGHEFIERLFSKFLETIAGVVTAGMQTV